MATYKCKKCGSDDVLVKAFVNPNTGDYEGWEDEFSTKCYCLDCDCEQDFVIVDD